MWANELYPTYGWRANGAMFVISAIACAMRVASASPLFLSAMSPRLISRLATTAMRSALPVRSPYPLMQPWTWTTPEATAAIEFATAQPESLCAWMPRARRDLRRDLADDARHVVGKHPAVGVAQHEGARPGVGGRLERTHAVDRVEAVAVEEVLGVEDHAAVVGDEEGDGVARSSRGSRRRSS